MNEEELEKAIASAKKSLDSTRPINYAPPNEETEEERPNKRCGECMSDGIHPDAKRCPHCGAVFATDKWGLWQYIGAAAFVFYALKWLMGWEADPAGDIGYWIGDFFKKLQDHP